MRPPTFIIVLIALAAVALSPPPLPKRPHKSAAVHQGAGALALVTKLAPPPPALPLTNIFVWKFPATVTPSNLWWNVESSTDLQYWTVAVSNASGNSTIIVNKTEPLRVFRLTGRNTP